jgi:hypothetical protein
MNEEILDASAIDEFNDYELTGDEEDLPQEEAPEDNNEEPSTETNSEEPVEDSSEDEDDAFTAEVLRLKGIQDPSKIKFEDESGAIVERSWDDLSDNERLNILANGEDPERDLEDDEIQLINFLRQNNLTPQQYVQAVQNQAAQQALEQYQQTQTPVYEIDSLSDDELFALDLLDKVGEENITDEELQEALEHAKSNETLYAKQIEGLRASYKNLEDQQKYDAEQAQNAQAEQQYQDFSNQVLNEINTFNSFANQEIELSTDDKNDIANYMLTRRDSGISDFYQDIQNPAVATQAAFWLLRGPEVLSEMENQVRAAYQRGFNMGKANNYVPSVTPKTPTVVVQPKPTPTTTNTDFQSAFGLEDESYLN